MWGSGILNLGEGTVALSLQGMGFEACASVNFESYWATGDDVARQGITVPELQHTQGMLNISSSALTLPGYSTTVVQCSASVT